ncbi:MAG TPA: hypothetical protein VKP03_02220 [Patescibacteria group bacterium]|nr:hypothetical protein [Patescibacteria group bacterium]
MKWQARYLLLLIFIMLVLTAMFFIYSNVKTEERYLYYQGEPTKMQRLTCFLKGGVIERQSGLKEQEDLKTEFYFCHFH